MTDDPLAPRLRFRLLLDRPVAIGPGKADLLAAIARTGSIAAAGRATGMSHGKAWALITATNGRFREALVVSCRGGHAHGGAELTPMGETVLALCRAIERRASQAVAADLDCCAQLPARNPPGAEPFRLGRGNGADPPISSDRHVDRRR
ncbi:MAG: LysR family transcriptional regulator [Rhodobacteraceae bacterium]|nr:LysR family transcriptional regulator [Paracoccaceae bacterium]